jgi:hypothetical protein
MRYLGRSQSVIHLRTVTRNVLGEGGRAVIDLKFELSDVHGPIHVVQSFSRRAVPKGLSNASVSLCPGIFLRMIYFNVLE